jgi:DNA-binding response OmpR family regulator
LAVTGEEAVTTTASRQIMIVDDDLYILEVIKELFESEGIDVVTADSGDACLAELERGFRGVILMDIMMPRKDGWDTISEMIDRDLIEGNIVAMLTAKDVPDVKLEYLKEHVIDYITKPFDADEIVAIVKGYLDYLS